MLEQEFFCLDDGVSGRREVAELQLPQLKQVWMISNTKVSPGWKIDETCSGCKVQSLFPTSSFVRRPHVRDMTTFVARHEALRKAPCLRNDPLL